MDYKTALGFISASAAFIGLLPYIRSTLAGRTIPHFFTWLVWTLLTVIIFVIQVQGQAGPGAWGTGITALTCIVILGLSLRFGQTKGTRLDWVALVVSLAIIPLWLLTDDPLGAAILVTLIDIVAFYPTVAKTYVRPHSEDLFYYWIWLVKYPASLLALKVLSVANALYPATWTLIGVLFLAMALIRRKALTLNAA